MPGRANEALENGRNLELLLNRWALEGSEANSTQQLVVPAMLSFGPFMAWGGQYSMVRCFVRLGLRTRSLIF